MITRSPFNTLLGLERIFFKVYIIFLLLKNMQRLYKGGDIQKPMKLGMGYADELHHEFRKPEHILKVKVFDKDDIWSADLIEMHEENKCKYILAVIDLYTKYA